MSSRSRRSRSPRFKRRQSVVREQIDVEGRPPDSTGMSSTPSKFDQLLELIKAQNGLISEQSKASNAQNEEIKAELRAQLHTMNKHTTMLQALETDATKDDKAYEGRALGDAQTWNALDKESLAKVKVMVEEWREVMQISLVFIALFLTVVTAFICPVIQTFMTPSESSPAKMPPPSVPTQLVALFYYLALITSISNSILCVLGMQWGARLIATPLGNTNLERALARQRRMLTGETKMRSLMGVLVWTILLSIGFFVLGFLIQLWELAFSFAGPAPILIVGGALATGLTLVILGIIMVTTIHAALSDNSPFESPLSNAMKPLLQWIRRRVRHQGHDQSEDEKKKDESSEGGSPKGAEDVGALVRWKEDDGTNISALKTYAQLVLNTNDAELLERAVPSFEFGQGYLAGNSLLPLFRAVRERFLATDTSFRVKETVHKQLTYLKDWDGWKDPGGFRYWREDLKANDFTRWCQTQCLDMINSSRGVRRDFFHPLALLTSLEEDNRDLRDYTFHSVEECIARILCTFDSDRELGNREEIFDSAVWTCVSLFLDGKTDDLTSILSFVDRASVVQSLIRNPHYRWFGVRDVATFITKGKEVEVLDELYNFFSDLPEMSVAHDAYPLLVCEFLEDIIYQSPSVVTPPPSLDLAPVLDLVQHNALFRRYSQTLTYYLNRGALHSLSDLRAASKLWEYCRDVHSEHENSDEVVAFYENHDCCFIPLPPPSGDECDNLARNICALIAPPKVNIFVVKAFKRPILELLNLDNDQTNTVVTQILSEVPRSDFVDLLIWKSHLPWALIQDLVLSTARDHEVEILTDMPNAALLNSPNQAMSVFLDFLGGLVPSLPFDFDVPRSFDLSQVIYHLSRYQRKRQTWRKHADTIIAYLDRGAFEQISRNYLVDAANFFQLCMSESQKMKEWEDEERTSEYTRDRAISYREKLKARATRDLDLARDLRPYFPEGFEQPSSAIPIPDEPSLSVSKAAWNFPFRNLRNAFGKAPRSTVLLNDGPDIELGRTAGSSPHEDGP
ncbi:hypothetical protein SISNIDRAFT_454175 [Sistotremastrum niveocremeum HHB9708]|uniref:DUF6535 domain-containing protein n=1 Tax=Sistotremastrum niveocremeum HHB9708 TaxID=1314777 RepID=A0A164V2F5_9AGAM|nr:hypothetical protein SISNIDRAFT_454175 [Sistotremastrum niveocremeum HHB9708]